ncbi:MAG: hypothetical protein R2845_02995 [Thermomicrobiales bacterium]
MPDGEIEVVGGDDTRRDPSVHHAARPRNREERRQERENRTSNTVLAFPTQVEREQRIVPDLPEPDVEKTAGANPLPLRRSSRDGEHLRSR